MRLSKGICCSIIVAAALALSPSAGALVQQPTAKSNKTVQKSVKTTQKSTKTAVKPIKKKKTARKTPYILTPKAVDLTTLMAPHPHRFSPEFNEALARGDLNQTYRHLQLEEASDKTGYMINQVLLAMGKGGSHGQSVSAFDRGTAFHNLYLYVARQGRPAPKFLKEAAKYYRQAARKAGPAATSKTVLADKAHILLAALYASNGDTAKSQDYFQKVDIARMTHDGDDYSGLEYLALYYAATKQVDPALITLDRAYRLNPGALLLWLHVGDDFWMIEEEPAFQKRLALWQDQHQKKLAQLQRDKATHDARKKKK